MRRLSLVPVAVFAFLIGCSPAPEAPSGAQPARGATEPCRTENWKVEAYGAWENMQLFLICCPSPGNGEPCEEFAESVARRAVKVREIGAGEQAQVNLLEFKNESDSPVFLQAGQIVKGGKQDRALGTDAILPAHSAPVTLPAFCVEHGRWTPISHGNSVGPDDFTVPPGKSSAGYFEGVACMGGLEQRRIIQIEGDQARVWESNRNGIETYRDAAQGSAAIGESGLLTRENYRGIVEAAPVREWVEKCRAALLAGLTVREDAVGVVFVVNRTVQSADVYRSHALFSKLLPQLLDASAVESWLAKSRKADEQPPIALAEVRKFVDDLNGAPGKERQVNTGLKSLIHAVRADLLFEYLDPDSGFWIHRTYMRK